MLILPVTDLDELLSCERRHVVLEICTVASISLISASVIVGNDANQ